ncbi:MAG TPA: hypothetical protein PK328_11435 [Chitinophagaceae bacterium]|nr:hypothetical protein [Chitinophagaceae bacterium]
MSKILIFIGGFVAGILATILVAYLVALKGKPNDGLIGLKLFPKKGDCITSKGKLEVFQVIAPNMALSETGKYPNEIMVLLINYNGEAYYDDQKITIPNNRCAKQIGTYQYSTRMGFEKTVPAVVIE